MRRRETGRDQLAGWLSLAGQSCCLNNGLATKVWARYYHKSLSKITLLILTFLLVNSGAKIKKHCNKNISEIGQHDCKQHCFANEDCYNCREREHGDKKHANNTALHIWIKIVQTVSGNINKDFDPACTGDALRKQCKTIEKEVEIADNVAMKNDEFLLFKDDILEIFPYSKLGPSPHSNSVYISLIIMPNSKSF